MVREGRFEEAIPAIRKLLVRNPGDLKARNLLGIALMSSGKRAEASIEFRKAIATDPKFHPAIKNLAMNELQAGQIKEAKTLFERAAKLVPKDAVVQFHLGQIAFRERSYAAAARYFEASQTGFPDPYQAGYNLVLAYVRAGNAAGAAAAGEQMIANGHRKAELYNLLSRAYEQIGRTKEAYDALREAIGLEPASEANYVDLMALCLDHENWELSLEIAAVGLERIPNASRIRLQRGAVYALKGDLDQAEQDFRAAAKTGKTNVPFVALALIEIQRNNPAAAAALLRERRALQRGDPLVNWFLAEAISLEAPEPGTPSEKEAVEALEEAVKANPKVAPTRALLGKFLARRGETARAVRELEAALKLDPADSNAAYQLAMLYRRSGANAKRAEELFAQVAKATQANAESASQAARRAMVRIIREGSQ